MTKYYREKIQNLEEAVEALKGQQKDYKLDREFAWTFNGWQEVDLSPKALFQRIEKLAQATGFDIILAPSSPSYYTAVKIKEEAK